MNEDFFKDYVVVKGNIALRRNESPNAKAPVLKGWVTFGKQELIAALASLEEKGLSRISLDVALWDSKSQMQDYDGTVILRDSEAISESSVREGVTSTANAIMENFRV